MADTEVRAVYRTNQLEEYPSFDETYHIDEQETPTTVTIWSTECDDEVSTEWISCPSSFAIPIEAIR